MNNNFESIYDQMNASYEQINNLMGVMYNQIQLDPQNVQLYEQFIALGNIARSHIMSQLTFVDTYCTDPNLKNFLLDSLNEKELHVSNELGAMMVRTR